MSVLHAFVLLNAHARGFGLLLSSTLALHVELEAICSFERGRRSDAGCQGSLPALSLVDSSNQRSGRRARLRSSL